MICVKECMRTHLKRIIEKVAGCLSVACLMVTFMASKVYAVDGIFDSIGADKDSNGAFDGLTQQVVQTGNSGLKFMLVLGVLAVILGIGGIGLTLAVNLNAKGGADAKMKVLLIVCACVLVFGARTIASSLAKIGSSLGDDTTTVPTKTEAESETEKSLLSFEIQGLESAAVGTVLEDGQVVVFV